LITQPKFDTREEHIKNQFDPESVEYLNSITDETGAKIVVSSSWRSGRTVDDLQKLFQFVGITGEVIDKTSRLNFANWNTSVPRGCEIEHWIDTHKELLGQDKYDYKSYVILDDDSDMVYYQKDNFFKTSFYEGLTRDIANNVINFLNGN
jgi:CO dehydrogenase/acetyl-CoA synthase alpha subunit